MGRKLIFGLFAIVIAASFVFISGDVIAADKKKEAPNPVFWYFGLPDRPLCSRWQRI